MQTRFEHLEAMRVQRVVEHRERRLTQPLRGEAISQEALRAALPVHIYEALTSREE